MHRRVDLVGDLGQVPMMAHQHRRAEDDRGRVGDALTGDIGRGAVDGSAMATSAPIFSAGASPNPPPQAAAISDKISP